MSLKKLIKETVESDIVNHVVDIIEQSLNIQLNKESNLFKYLDSGSFAKVYSIENHPDKVLRIEDDIYETWFSEVEGLDLDHVVKVYYTKIVGFNFTRGNKTQVEITVMEKLNPLDKEDVENLSYIFDEYLGFSETHLPENWESMSDFKNVKHIIKDIQEGLKELGVHLNDLHAGNIMKDPKTGKYKIIDLSNV